jgi:hypothetical protein
MNGNLLSEFQRVPIFTAIKRTSWLTPLLYPHHRIIQYRNKRGLLLLSLEFSLFVLDGEIEVLVNDVWQHIKKGEGLRFNANQPHGYRNPTPKLVCFHDIIHYPNHDTVKNNL